MNRPLGALLALAACSLLACAFAPACGLDARPADLRYELQADTRKALAGSPEALKAVEELVSTGFGSPLDPRYPTLASWSSKGFGPAHPDRPLGHGGAGEITSARADELRADNRKVFASQLAAIERGEFDDVDAPRGHPELHARFVATAQRPSDERRGAARALFEDFYPALAESAELYRIECAHCHGNSGGGDGPTSNFIEPRPRDFRRGIFKWTSVSDAARPTRDDLLRLLDRGVYGTAMPSFRRLSQSEREGLVDYTRLLAIRGEVERELVLAHEDGEELDDATFADVTQRIVERWQRAATKVVAWDGEIPPATPEAIALGDQLFHDPRKGNCAACHGDEGRGDGPVAFKIDDRGRKVAAYQDAWGFDILPRNLRRDPFRGGGRPIDLYRRVYCGINGGPMPSLSNVLDARETWAVVHYTRTLAAGRSGQDEGELAAGSR